MTTTTTKKSMIRSRKGQYVKECLYCSCPDGCGCEGQGCPCGFLKAKPRKCSL